MTHLKPFFELYLESTDESEAEKMHCMNNSGSSATYSDYSPSQGSSGSSNPPGNVSNMQNAGKEGPTQTHWTNRLVSTTIVSIRDYYWFIYIK